MASILLIDDDEPLRSITAEFLRQAGYTVNDAPDGKTGLMLYEAEQHDLIITDIVMPEMEGLELIERLRNAVSRPRIIAVSGGTSFSHAVYLPTAKHLGAQRTLDKPVRPDLLLRTIAEVLAEPAPPTMPRPGNHSSVSAGAEKKNGGSWGNGHIARLVERLVGKN